MKKISSGSMVMFEKSVVKLSCQPTQHKHDGVCQAKLICDHHQRQNDQYEVNILNEHALHE